MKKPTVIILHGWNLSGGRFAPLSREFERLGYTVYAPDLPGFGDEPAPRTPWHVADYAAFLRRYVERNNIGPVLLVGHSFGGRVALEYTHRHPDRVTALVLTGTPGFSPIPSKKLMLFLVISKIGGAVFSLPILNIIADRARKFLYYVAGAREFIRAEGAMRQTFKNVVRDNLVPAMESIRIPCLLLWGELDVIVPTVIAERMLRAIPEAKLTVVPEADHGVPFKEPKVFVGYVTSFLASYHRHP